MVELSERYSRLTNEGMEIIQNIANQLAIPFVLNRDLTPVEYIATWEWAYSVAEEGYRVGKT